MAKSALRRCFCFLMILGLKFPFIKISNKPKSLFGYHPRNQCILKRPRDDVKKKMIDFSKILWFIAMQTFYIIASILATRDIPYLLFYSEVYERSFEIALAIWLSFSVIVYICVVVFLLLNQCKLRNFEKKLNSLVRTIHPYDNSVFSKSSIGLLFVTVIVHLTSQFATYLGQASSTNQNIESAHYDLIYRALLMLEFCSSFCLSVIEIFHTVMMICACFFEATETKVAAELDNISSNKTVRNTLQEPTFKHLSFQDLRSMKHDAFLLDECHQLASSLFTLPLFLVNITLLTTMSVGIYLGLDTMLSSGNLTDSLVPLLVPAWALLFLLLLHYTADAFRIKVSMHFYPRNNMLFGYIYLHNLYYMQERHIEFEIIDIKVISSSFKNLKNKYWWRLNWN